MSSPCGAVWACRPGRSTTAASERPSVGASWRAGAGRPRGADLDTYEEAPYDGPQLPHGRFLDRERSWLAF
ncbi:hypothetical protein, partial [Streptomyces sp. NPDC005476]|uniref:hypothetical protein n=1 Tax=Streptomyces sp. NPDC005476 TaxID=3156882 RepID=UPI003454A476